MTQPQLTVVIIGGGIGGLFAANALIAHGFDVSVYEQAPALGEVGAGVFLTPNSVRQLQRVGLGHQVERWGARVGHGSHYFRHDGAPIAPVQVTDSAGWNATFGMHRADLVEMLASALPSGVVRTGHRGTGFEQTSEVARVSFANGAVAEGDVVIAADGIHSELRPYAAPPSRPVFHGSVAYRGVLPHAAHSALADRLLADVARQGKTFSQLSGAIGRAHQLCRLRAGRCGNEGIMVGARRSRCAAPRVSRAGTRASGPC